jgi:levansucrase
MVLGKQSTSRWQARHVAAIGDFADQLIPAIPADLPRPLIANLDLWDMWPLQLADGSTATLDGWTLWFILSAPALPDPELRHGVARIRLITERDGQWRDCGNALPDGLNPGSREWAGSALFDPATARVTLFFTAAGHRGEDQPSYAQRLFQTSGTLIFDGGVAAFNEWSVPTESFVSDNRNYVLVNQAQGRPGFIKGFRDPAHFNDPADGKTYLLFTGSLKASDSAWNGCVGIAKADCQTLDRWTLLPPLLSADSLNNEQERPHVIHHSGLYYLFWSTQRHVFAPDGPSGPNGLYGSVAPSLLGPYQPLNGTGLVAANPPQAPFQAYSWWVTNDLSVFGFVDLIGPETERKQDDPNWRRDHFGGVPAPVFHLKLDGDRAGVA